MSTKKPTLSLEILTAHFREINTSLALAQSLQDQLGSRTDYVVEMSKLMGLLSGLVQEGTYLMMDCGAIVKDASGVVSPAASSTDLKTTELFGKTVKKSNN
jgi:hypothetical protein